MDNTICFIIFGPIWLVTFAVFVTISAKTAKLRWHLIPHIFSANGVGVAIGLWAALGVSGMCAFAAPIAWAFLAETTRFGIHAMVFSLTLSFAVLASLDWYINHRLGPVALIMYCLVALGLLVEPVVLSLIVSEHSFMGLTVAFCGLSLVPLWLYTKFLCPARLPIERVSNTDIALDDLMLERRPIWHAICAYLVSVLVMVVYAFIHSSISTNSAKLGWVTLGAVVVYDIIFTFFPVESRSGSPTFAFVVFAAIRLAFVLSTENYWFLAHSFVFSVIAIAFLYRTLSPKSGSLASLTSESEIRSHSALINLDGSLSIFNNPVVLILLATIFYIIEFMLALFVGTGLPSSEIAMLDNSHPQWRFGVFGMCSVLLFAPWFAALNRLFKYPRPREVFNELDPLETQKGSRDDVLLPSHLRRYLLQKWVFFGLAYLFSLAAALTLFFITSSQILLFSFLLGPLIIYGALAVGSLWSRVDWQFSLTTRVSFESELTFVALRGHIIGWLVAAVVADILLGVLFLIFINPACIGLILLLLPLAAIAGYICFKHYTGTLMLSVVEYGLIGVAGACLLCLAIIGPIVYADSLHKLACVGTALGSPILVAIIAAILKFRANKRQATLYVKLVYGIVAGVFCCALPLYAIFSSKTGLFIVASFVAGIIVGALFFGVGRALQRTALGFALVDSLVRYLAMGILGLLIIFGLLIGFQGEGVFWGVSICCSVVVFALLGYGVTAYPFKTDAKYEMAVSGSLFPVFSYQGLDRRVAGTTQRWVGLIVSLALVTVWGFWLAIFKEPIYYGLSVTFLGLSSIGVVLSLLLNWNASIIAEVLPFASPSILSEARGNVFSTISQVLPIEEEPASDEDLTDEEAGEQDASPDETSSGVAAMMADCDLSAAVHMKNLRKQLVSVLKFTSGCYSEMLETLTELSDFLRQEGDERSVSEIILLPAAEKAALMLRYEAYRKEQQELNDALRKERERQAEIEAERLRKLAEEEERRRKAEEEELERRRRLQQDERLRNIYMKHLRLHETVKSLHTKCKAKLQEYCALISRVQGRCEDRYELLMQQIGETLLKTEKMLKNTDWSLFSGDSSVTEARTAADRGCQTVSHTVEVTTFEMDTLTRFMQIIQDQEENLKSISFNSSTLPLGAPDIVVVNDELEALSNTLESMWTEISSMEEEIRMGTTIDIEAMLSDQIDLNNQIHSIFDCLQDALDAARDTIARKQGKIIAEHGRLRTEVQSSLETIESLNELAIESMDQFVEKESGSVLALINQTIGYVSEISESYDELLTNDVFIQFGDVSGIRALREGLESLMSNLVSVSAEQVISFIRTDLPSLPSPYDCDYESIIADAAGVSSLHRHLDMIERNIEDFKQFRPSIAKSSQDILHLLVPDARSFDFKELMTRFRLAMESAEARQNESEDREQTEKYNRMVAALDVLRTSRNNFVAQKRNLLDQLLSSTRRVRQKKDEFVRQINATISQTESKVANLSLADIGEPSRSLLDSQRQSLIGKCSAARDSISHLVEGDRLSTSIDRIESTLTRATELVLPSTLPALGTPTVETQTRAIIEMQEELREYQSNFEHLYPIAEEALAAENESFNSLFNSIQSAVSVMETEMFSLYERHAEAEEELHKSQDEQRRLELELQSLRTQLLDVSSELETVYTQIVQDRTSIVESATKKLERHIKSQIRHHNEVRTSLQQLLSNPDIQSSGEDLTKFRTVVSKLDEICSAGNHSFASLVQIVDSFVPDVPEVAVPNSSNFSTAAHYRQAIRQAESEISRQRRLSFDEPPMTELLRLVHDSLNESFDSYVTELETILIGLPTGDDVNSESIGGAIVDEKYALYKDKFREAIAQARQASNGKWTDPDFRNMKHPQSGHKHGRLTDFGGSALVHNSPDPDDVVQGQIGTCWLLSSLSVLAGDPAAWSNVFLDHDVDHGVYLVRFPNFDEPSYTLIDDRVPVTRSGFEYASNRDDSELWVPVGEKAFAKAYGGFTAVDGGSTGEALAKLFGGCVERLELSTLKNKRDRDALWERMKDMHDRRDGVLAASAHFGRSDREKSKSGIVQAHAYGVLRLEEVQDGGQTYRMIRLRNPWGCTEWKGKFSDHDNKNWTTRLKQMLDFVDRDDGAFWMEYTDLCKHYTDLAIVRTFRAATWVKQTWRGAWRGSQAAGLRTTSNVLLNPQAAVVFDHPLERDVYLQYVWWHSCKDHSAGVKVCTLGSRVESTVVGGSRLRKSQWQHYDSLGDTICYWANDFHSLSVVIPRGTTSLLLVPFCDPGVEGEFKLFTFVDGVQHTLRELS